MINKGPCSESDCFKTAYKRGLCQSHYGRLKRYGSPTLPTVTCKGCQTNFTVRKVGQKFCSVKCRDRWAHKQPSAKAAKLAWMKAYYKTERGRALIKRTNRNMRLKHAEKFKARSAVLNELRRGRLIKPEKCELCNSTERLEAHHYKGYDRENWLEIKWLCRPCHTKEEKKEELAG